MLRLGMLAGIEAHYSGEVGLWYELLVTIRAQPYIRTVC